MFLGRIGGVLGFACLQLEACEARRGAPLAAMVTIIKDSSRA